MDLDVYGASDDDNDIWMNQSHATPLPIPAPKPRGSGTSVQQQAEAKSVTTLPAVNAEDVKSPKLVFKKKSHEKPASPAASSQSPKPSKNHPAA